MNIQNIEDFSSDLFRLVKEYEPAACGIGVKLLMSADVYDIVREELSDFERHPPQIERGGHILVSGNTWHFEIIGQEPENI